MCEGGHYFAPYSIACFLGVQRLQQEARKFTDIPDLRIGSSFTVSKYVVFYVCGTKLL